MKAIADVNYSNNTKRLADGTWVPISTPTVNGGGGRRLMTPREIAAQEAEADAAAAAQPIEEWQARMAATDAKVPRYLEDLIDSLDGLVPIKDNLTGELFTAYTEKKTIRQQKPKG